MLYVIRHGQVDTNRKNQVDDWNEESLIQKEYNVNINKNKKNYKNKTVIKEKDENV